jgi:hypothetical protein
VSGRLPNILAAVDWDGTCVENAYPEMGDWLPGAIVGLQQLDELGRIVIHTCRVAPTEADNLTWRDPLDAAAEIAAIRRMLRKRGLEHVEIWTKPWKPSALCYIDDKGVPPFDGDWGAAVDLVTERLEAVIARG